MYARSGGPRYRRFLLAAAGTSEERSGGGSAVRRLIRGLARPRLAIPLLALVVAGTYFDYLVVPAPRHDERFYLDAGALHVAGRSPYEHAVFNYPPPLVQLVAAATRGEWIPGLIVGWRLANLGAVVALAWFSARRTGWTGAPLFLAALLVACSPVVRQAIRFGNLSPLVSLAALAGFALERRRPWISATLLGASLALKPVALGGAAFLSGHRLLFRRRGASVVAAIGWPVVAAVALVPGAALLPDMVARMSESYFDPYHLSIKSFLASLGWEVSSVWIAGAVVVAALLFARRRRVDPEEMVLFAPVVALAALPVAWGHTFALALPLQLAAIARLAGRLHERRRSGLGGRDLAEALAVGLAVAIPHAAASGVYVNDWAGPVQVAVSVLPVLSPAATLVYVLWSTPARTPSDEGRRAEVG